MDGMYYMSDTVNDKVACPMMMCPMMPMQQNSGNLPCMNYMYYNSPVGVSPFYRSRNGNNICPELLMQHVSSESLFQTKMASVPLSEIKD